MSQQRKYITIEELERLADVVICPAHLIEIVWEWGLDQTFAEHLAKLWCKNFSTDKNFVMLRKLEQNIGTSSFLS